MDCRQAIDELLAYAADAGGASPAPAAALAHLSTCAACARRLGHLARALGTPAEDRLTCRRCQEQLPAYLQAQLESRADAAIWQAVRLHLAGCPACSATLADLGDLLALAEGERGVEPAAYPARPPAFLKPRRTRQPWRIDRLGQLVVDLGRLLLPPPPGPAYASLKAGAGAAEMGRLVVDAAPDLAVTVTVERQPGAHNTCAVVVEVDIPSRGGWPNLAGSTVALRRGAADLAVRSTDAFGKAVFDDIATADLPALRITVRRQSE